MPLRLGVNIDHVATLRQARYAEQTRGQNTDGALSWAGFEPDPIDAAAICENAGAHGITVHLREDRRHMQERDIRLLKKSIRTKLNLEMAVAEEIIRFACDLKPHDVCLVPEKREEVTTEGGLDVAGNLKAVKAATRRLKDAGIIVSHFIDPDEKQIRAAAEAGADVVELHTGAYANAHSQWMRKQGGASLPQATFPPAVRAELDKLIGGAHDALECSLRVNAGHGINYQNIGGILEIPHLEELNIGHSIISRAVLVGLDRAVREMLALMKNYES
jgi:pyridoxine 5-phosphate synthase